MDIANVDCICMAGCSVMVWLPIWPPPLPSRPICPCMAIAGAPQSPSAPKPLPIDPGIPGVDGGAIGIIVVGVSTGVMSPLAGPSKYPEPPKPVIGVMGVMGVVGVIGVRGVCDRIHDP